MAALEDELATAVFDDEIGVLVVAEESTVEEAGVAEVLEVLRRLCRCLLSTASFHSLYLARRFASWCPLGIYHCKKISDLFHHLIQQVGISKRT